MVFSMPVDVKVRPLVIRFKGIFDYNLVYNSMRKFFDMKRYDFFEKAYKHKGRGPQTELEHIWYIQHELNEHIMNSYSIYMKINNFQYVYIKDENGKIKQMVSGRLFIDITPSVILDYNDRWRTSEFKKKLLEFYHEFILKKEIDEIYHDRLRDEAFALQEVFKKALGMTLISHAYDWKLKSKEQTIE